MKLQRRCSWIYPYKLKVYRVNCLFIDKLLFQPSLNRSLLNYFGAKKITKIAVFFRSLIRRLQFVSAPSKPKRMSTPAKRQLTPMEHRVIREKGTEPAFSGEYDKFYPRKGHFVCKACDNPLYTAASKFKSGCGWPAFDKCFKNAIKTHVDVSFGMRRVEIVCAACDGHLGHVFEGEHFTETNERHCVNSVSVRYVDQDFDAEEAKVV